MPACFRTVLKAGEGEYEEKRSRFLCRVYPVSSEDEVNTHLSVLKKKYWDASHHCYAYIIDNETTAQRFSDDGEPAGTAGLPILEAIRKKDLTNVLVVVIRYFGGTLLGASGLVRSYGKAATSGLDQAGVVVCKLCWKVEVSIDYSLYGRVQNVLIANRIAIAETSFTDIISLVLYIEPERMDFLEKEMAEISGGQAKLNWQEKTIVYFDENGNCLS